MRTLAVCLYHCAARTGILAAVSLLLWSCQSSAGSGAEDARLRSQPEPGIRAGVSPFDTGGLPPLPFGAAEQRALSFNNVAYYDGVGTYETSPGCIFAGTSTVVPAPAGGLEYAMYAFNTAGYDPDKLEVGLSVSANSAAWIGVSNYRKGAWQFFGPFTGLASLNLNGFNYLSPTGQFYTLVVAYDGVTVSSDYLVLTYDNAVKDSYSVSGTVLDEHGDPIGGARITSDPEFVEAVSDAQGNYYLSLSAPGDFTLNPSSLAGYTLVPMSPLSNVNGHVTGVDFTGSRVDVQGRIETVDGASLAGVTLVLNPGGTLATSGADGSFEFPGVASGLYTVEPQLAGYTFEPLGRNIDVQSADFSGCDFTATGGAPTYAIRGQIALFNSTPVAGVTLILNPGYRIALTDSNGNYAFFGVGNGSYTVEPFLGFYSFSPAARSETVADASVTDADFLATAPPPTYALSGTVMDGVYSLPIPNALVRISTKQSGKLKEVTSLLTGVDGRFSVNVPNGEYLIYPEKDYYNFQSPFWTIQDAPYDYIVFGSLRDGSTWESFVGEYVYNNCIQCHRPDSGTAASPNLRSYQEVLTSATLCNIAVQADAMPPGGGNLELYQKYFQEWMDNNKPER